MDLEIHWYSFLNRLEVPMIKVHHLVKRYKELLALDHMNLEVKEGEILGLLGPNGSGKTTLINCILGLSTYDKGDITIFGEHLRPNSYSLKKEIGYVPQDLALFDNLTVEQNIRFFCGLYVNDSKLLKTYVDEAIVFTGLQDFGKFTPKKLSGGLRRRLNIACGIAHKPKLIFLDEPTVAVDAQSRNFILKGIKDLNQNGSTIVYTSHYLEEIEAICDRVAIMDKGQNIAQGTLLEVKNSISTGEKIQVEFVKLSPQQEQELSQLQGLLSYEKKQSLFILEFKKGLNPLIPLMNFVEKNQLSYSSLLSSKPTLNDVFLTITGKELRDK